MCVCVCAYYCSQQYDRINKLQIMMLSVNDQTISGAHTANIISDNDCKLHPFVCMCTCVIYAQ